MKNDALPPTAAKKKHANKITHRDPSGKFKPPPATIPKTDRTPPTRKDS